jgi:hypothetical protein
MTKIGYNAQEIGDITKKCKERRDFMQGGKCV